MADDEKPRSPKKSKGPHYGVELAVLIAVAILYFAMTCGGSVAF